MIVHEERGKARRPESRVRQSSPARAFSALLFAGAMGQTACEPCPVDSECNAKEYHITLGEGESKNTVTKAVHRNEETGAVTMQDEVIHVEVLSIYQETRIEGSGVCTVTSGAATIRLTIESDPPYMQEVGVHSSMCYSVMEKCIAIHDVEVEQDVGDPVDGVCPISNEKVSFTLTIGG
ncbi:MAG: hypothetical protein AB1529_04870 [Candidatus Micrarchaeota archaeon]